MPEPDDKQVNSWTTLFAAFPVWKPQNLNAAIGWLEPQLNTVPPLSRVKAWCSYCCGTAFLDRWPHTSPEWGRFRTLSRPQLGQMAVQLATEAVAELPSPDPTTYAYAYDVYWAAGFVALHDRRWADADECWNAALSLRPTQSELVADYADALVFFGLPTVARFMATHSIGMAGGTVPYWLHWVEAWSYVGIAAVHFGRSTTKANDAANLALGALDEFAPPAQYRHPNGIPWDLDVTITRMLANHVLGRAQENANLWVAYQSIVSRADYKALNWRQTFEIARSPFHDTRRAAARLLNLMTQAIPAA